MTIRDRGKIKWQSCIESALMGWHFFNRTGKKRSRCLSAFVNKKDTFYEIYRTTI